MAKPIVLNDLQKRELRKLWWIYGNNGSKCTKGNHSYIQGLIEYDEDRLEFYVEGIKNMRENGMPENVIQAQAITQECIDAVAKILNSDGEGI